MRFFNQNIKVNDHDVGINSSCIIVAEIGPNHNGSFDLAIEMIKLAKKAGCDAVKFQYRNADEEIFDKKSSSYYFSMSRYDFIKTVQEFTHEQHEKLRRLCKDLNLIYICSVMTDVLIDAVASLKPDFIKIPSGEVNNPWLVEKAIKTNIPLVISSGMSNEEEINTTVSMVQELKQPNLILLHCLSEYPTKLEDMNLRYLDKLQEKYGCLVGLSDHSKQILPIASSVMFNSSMIEVHFTTDSQMEGPDHQVSLEYDELTKLVSMVRTLEKAKGRSVKMLGKNVKSMRSTFTNSLVASEDIIIGDIFSRNNLRLMKPGTGLGVEFISKILGSKANKNIKKGQLIQLNDLEKL